MKIEIRTVTNEHRTVTIREAEDIWEDDRRAAIDEYLSALNTRRDTCFETEDFSVRGGRF